MMKRSLISIVSALLLVGGVSSQSPYTYEQNGADWPAKWETCGYTNQSPIDMKMKEWPYYKAALDNFQKIYTNQVGNIEIVWTGKTTRVFLTGMQRFQSDYSALDLEASPRYSADQFQVRHGSEHTVEGKRHDIELQVQHSPDTQTASGVSKGMIAIMFSVEDYTAQLSPNNIKIIDNFFDQLKWDNINEEDNQDEQDKDGDDAKDGDQDKDADADADADKDNKDDGKRMLQKQKSSKIPNPIVNKVDFGDLMMLFDSDRKWAYQGSRTVPPCSTGVYWNVLRTIYPIKKKHVDQFVAQLERVEEYDLFLTGNYRIAQKYDNHDAQMMITPEINNRTIEELIREYLAFNKYEGTLAKMIEESEVVGNSRSLTRNELITGADIVPTSQTLPLIYDLVLRVE